VQLEAEIAADVLLAAAERVVAITALEVEQVVNVLCEKKTERERERAEKPSGTANGRQ
jgi:hypothetical protein